MIIGLCELASWCILREKHINTNKIEAYSIHSTIKPLLTQLFIAGCLCVQRRAGFTTTAVHRDVGHCGDTVSLDTNYRLTFEVNIPARSFYMCVLKGTLLRYVSLDTTTD